MSTVSRGSLAAAITLALGVSHAHATNFDVTNTNDSGAGSFRQALIDAAADSNIPHTINLSAIAGQTIDISSRLLMAPGQDMDLSIVGSDVTVAGDGSSGVIQFGGGQMQRGGGYYPDLDLDVSISDLTISGGDSSEPGGGILFEGSSKYQGSLTLNNVTVTGNTSDEVGGGIAAYGGSLTIIDSTITSNTAGTGGGVFHLGSQLSVSGTRIDDNTAYGADDQGPMGREWAGSSRLAERGLSIGGTAGGILGLTADGAQISESSISGNSSNGSIGGGMIISEFGNVTIDRTSVTENTANSYGGGIYAGSYDGNITINATTISGNSAEGIGGAFLTSYYGDVSLNNSTVSGNSSDFEVGGVLAFTDIGQIDFNFSTIVNNTTGEGVGGALMSAGSGYIGAGEDGTSGIAFGPSANTSIISGNLANGVLSDLGGDGLILLGNERLADFALLASARQRVQDRGLGLGSIINVNQTLLGSISLELELDAVSQDLLGQNPLLGPLSDNGGPTLTHLPGAGSPVYNLVPSGVLGCGTTFSDDQRGIDRPQEAACELGSVELQGAPMAAPLAVPIGNRFGLLLMAGLLGLAGLMGMGRRRNPLA